MRGDVIFEPGRKRPRGAWLVATSLALAACEPDAPLRDIADPAARARAVLALPPDDRARVPELVALLHHEPDASVREAVARVLGGMRDRRAAMALALAAANDRTTAVRRAACRSLGELGYVESIAPLLGLWRVQRGADDEAVHLSASQALVDLGTDAIPALVRVAADPDWRVRWLAAHTLGRLPRRPASAAALEALARDPDARVRDAAEAGLAAPR